MRGSPSVTQSVRSDTIKPSLPLFDAANTYLYCVQDLYVGAEVVINDFNFALANADEYTLAFMENNRHLFVMADGGAVLTLLRAQLAVRIALSLVVICCPGAPVCCLMICRL